MAGRPQHQAHNRGGAAMRWVLALGLLLGHFTLLHGQTEPEVEPPTTAMQLPDGTVVFFTDQPDLKNVPAGGVLLSAKQYQALIEKSARLKDLTQSPTPTAPSRCVLQGRVVTRGQRSVARFTATYGFLTTSPNQVIALGGQRAFPVAAKLDDEQLPELKFSKSGLTVRIAEPGKHQLVLDWEVPIGVRANTQELGFDFDLPRAAITTLEFTPPKSVSELRVGTRINSEANDVKRQTVEAATLRPGKENSGYPLGATELLELTWTMPSDSETANDVVLKAETEVTVRFTDEEVVTTAKIRLLGKNPEWQLRLPANADVTAEPIDGVSVGPELFAPDSPMPMVPMPSIETPTDTKKPIWKFRPTISSVGEWELTATVRQPRGNGSKARETFAVGPFDVLDAVEQSGLIQLFAPQTVRVAYETGDNVRQIDQTRPGDDFLATFQFTTVRTKPEQTWDGPLLKLEARPAPGFVRVQPRYQLRKTDGGWRLESTTTITPIRSQVEQLAIDIPAVWEGIEIGPPDLVIGVETVEATDTNPRRLMVSLFPQRKTPFELTLSATYRDKKSEQSLATDNRVSLPLPEFFGSVPSDAEVTAIVPDGLRVHGIGTEWNGQQTGIKLPLVPVKGSEPLPDFTRVRATFRKGVATVDLEWEPYRPNLSASIEVEVGLQRSQMIVSETIRLKSKDRPIPAVTLRGPSEAIAVPSDFRLEKTGLGEWLFTPEQADVTEAVIRLSYGLPLSDDLASKEPRQVPVELFWPTTATRCETRLRVWGAGSVLPLKRFEGPWLLLAPLPEPTSDNVPLLQAVIRDQLPWLTLTGTGLNLPLQLEFAATDNALLPNTVIDRALIHAWLGNDGRPGVHGQFVVSRWPADGLRLELPVGVIPDIRIDNQSAKYMIDSTAERPTQIRVALPAPDDRPIVLDVGYLVAASGSRDRTVRIPPPRFPQAVFRTPPRWELFPPPDAPDDAILVLQSSARADFTWSWNGLLLMPQAGTSPRQLQEWLRPNQAAEETLDSALQGEPRINSVTLTQPELGVLTVYHLPQVGLMAVCSLLALAIGLIFSQLRPVWFGPLLAILGIGLAVVVLFWPQLAAQCLAAMEPGLLALGLILLVIGLLRWYHHRRIHHLPGFTRMPPDSGSRRNEPAERFSNDGWSAASGSVPPAAAPAMPAGSSGS